LAIRETLVEQSAPAESEQPTQPQVESKPHLQPEKPLVEQSALAESKQPTQPQVESKPPSQPEKPVVEQSAPAESKQPTQPQVESKPPFQLEKPNIGPAPAEQNASRMLQKSTDDVDNEYLAHEEKIEFCADIILSPNICSQEDDVSLQLLEESSATNYGDKDGGKAESTFENKQHKDHVLLEYPFVGGFEIEKATKVLDLCVWGQEQHLMTNIL
jgi:hypothetical protein